LANAVSPTILTFRKELGMVVGLYTGLLALIALDSDFQPFVLLRIALGVVAIFCLPGYFIQAAAFPHRHSLSHHERVFIALGLSIAPVLPISLFFDGVLNIPITLPIVLLVETGLTAAAMLVAWLRRRAVREDDRFMLRVQAGRWALPQKPVDRIIYGVLFLALAAALALIALINVLTGPAQQFTEFYIVDEAGLAEDYPRGAVVGEPLIVLVGVHNVEGTPLEYRVEAYYNETLMGTLPPFTLNNAERSEQPLTFTLAAVDANARVEFLLYRTGDPTPYRGLRLWLDARAAP
jgi:uncharacterized membrane protein